MLARTLLKCHALRDSSIASMTRGGGSAILVSTPRKRKAALTAVASPALPNACASAESGQPPPTPAQDAALRRSRRTALPRALELDAAAAAAPAPAVIPPTATSDPASLPSSEPSALPPPIAAAAAAVGEPPPALTAAAAGRRTVAGAKKRAPRAPAAPWKPTKAAVAAAAVAAAAEIPALPALTPETMPAALAHLTAADPGTPCYPPLARCLHAPLPCFHRRTRRYAHPLVCPSPATLNTAKQSSLNPALPCSAPQLRLAESAVWWDVMRFALGFRQRGLLLLHQPLWLSRYRRPLSTPGIVP